MQYRTLCIFSYVIISFIGYLKKEKKTSSKIYSRWLKLYFIECIPVRLTDTISSTSVRWYLYIYFLVNSTYHRENSSPRATRFPFARIIHSVLPSLRTIGKRNTPATQALGTSICMSYKTRGAHPWKGTGKAKRTARRKRSDDDERKKEKLSRLFNIGPRRVFAEPWQVSGT